jgi:cytochrome c oxidase subunit 2
VKERTIFALTILTLVLLAAGYWAATTVDVMPLQASSRAVAVDGLFRALIGMATVIFLLVEGALVYAVLRFRRKPGEQGEGAGYHGNNALEIVWTLIPAVLVTVIGIYSFQVLTDIERPAEDEVVVEVTGRQFSWEFYYPEFELTSSELHLPLERDVRFQITSADVIHSFWVPEFRAKRDATPGQVSELLVRTTLPGRFPIRCAELCGPGHAGMLGQVVVEGEPEFLAWVESMRSIPSDPLEAGRFLFLRYGCNTCHTLTDVSAVGVVGPSLDGIGERAATRVPGLDARGYITESILEPSAFITPGFQDGLMPPNFSQRISAGELELIVNYLLGR